jgi:hypothetical protein
LINVITIESIEKEVEKLNEELLNYRSLVIDNQISNYPIFEWNVFLTHLEELYHKKIVEADKIDDFKLQYKDKNDKYCILFVSSIEEMGFLYCPILY